MSSCCSKDTGHYKQRTISGYFTEHNQKMSTLYVGGGGQDKCTQGQHKRLANQKKMDPLYCTFLEQSEPCIDK